MKTRKTKQQRKLSVLKDALAQIKARKYQVACGNVFEAFGELDDKIWTGSNEEGQAKTLINESLKNDSNVCEVCARGALLVSRIRLENKFTVDDLKSINGYNFEEDSVEDQYLMKIFSARELKMMENAFEAPPWRDYGINIDQLNDEDHISSFKFGKRYKNATNRLIAILENAIKNKGTFKP